MARPTREGYRQLSTQVPGELLDGMQSLAERHARSLADELTHAMRRHIAHPPDLLAPPLPAGDAGPAAAPPAPPGRKPAARKAAAPRARKPKEGS